MTAQTRIPVADALDPQFGWQSAWQLRESVEHKAELREWIRRLFFTVLVVLAFVVSLSLTQQNLNWGYKFGLVCRYTLWPMIVVGSGLAIHRYGFRQVVSGYGRFLPFVLFGVIASIFTLNPIASFRVMLQWLVFVTGAAAAGIELGSDRLGRVCFWTLAAIMIGSLMVWVVAPDFASQVDPRSGHDLRGLVSVKNAFGLVYIYGIAFCITASGIGRFHRAVMFGLALICAYLSHSAGSEMEMVAVMCFAVGVSLIRRLPFTPSLQAATFVTIFVLGVLFVVFGAETILGAFGRDMTLTGRVDAWPAYLRRALHYWSTGAGPGTFSAISFATVDVARGLPSGGGGYLETPHNMFIAVFGEVGLFGLVAFVGALAIPAFFSPFLDRRPGVFTSAAAAFAMLVAGLSETREVFGTGVGAFLVVSTCAAYLRNSARQPIQEMR